MDIDPTTVDDREAPGSWTISEPGSLELPELHLVRLAVVSGSVDVVGRDEPGARLEVHDLTGPGLRIETADGVLRIAPVAGVHAQRARAVLSLAVQRDAAVDLEVTSADALVSGTTGGVRIAGVSGDLVCDATAGTARIESVSGEIALRDHTGPVELVTVSGDATVSGAITRLDARGVSAEVFLDLADPERIDVRSVSGAVVARLHSGRAADYEIRTISGRVHLDGADVPRVRGTFRGSWDGAGESGGPALRMRVESASGSVRVVHADPG